MAPQLASLCRQLVLISFGKSTEPTRAAHHEMEGIFGTAQELPGSTTIEVGTSEHLRDGASFRRTIEGSRCPPELANAM